MMWIRVTASGYPPWVQEMIAEMRRIEEVLCQLTVEERAAARELARSSADHTLLSAAERILYRKRRGVKIVS